MTILTQLMAAERQSDLIRAARAAGRRRPGRLARRVRGLPAASGPRAERAGAAACGTPPQAGSVARG